MGSTSQRQRKRKRRERSRDMRRGECNIKHGGSGSRLYNVWKQMRIRCKCSTNPTYKHYGGRGITICKAWDDFSEFRKWAAENGYSEDLTIERIDVNGNYTPENCTWIPRSEQAKNTRNAKRYEYAGRCMCHNDWARHLGISPSTLTERIRRHGIHRALSMVKYG